MDAIKNGQRYFMKTRFIFPLILLSTSILFFSSCKKEYITPKKEDNTIDSTSQIAIDISGIKKIEGSIVVALYNSADNFNNPSKVFREYYFPVTATKMLVTLDSIPEGTYAFAIIDDENNNKNLDKNGLGIPKEGFCFSNNALKSFGPPSFDDAKFYLPIKTKLTQYVSLVFY